jgi:hypothetical protein
MDHANVTRRSLVLAAALGLAGCATSTLPAGDAPAANPAPRLRLLGETRLPHRMDFRGSVVGGISGIDYDPAADLWYLLSDDRSDLNPARFYTARLPLGADGPGALELLDVVTLRQPDGSPYPSRRSASRTNPQVPDPESIRWRPGTGTLLWSSEGDAKLGLDPFVREIRPDGSHVREIAMPGMFRMQGQGAGQGSGPRDNLVFEGLGTTPDGQQLWVAMEAPLAQDGPLPAVGAKGGPCRFTCFDLASGTAVRQIAYVPDPIPRAPQPPSAFADNGVSEILMLDNQRMLVLERAYMAGYPAGQGNSLRMYLIDTARAPDTLNTAVLRAGSYQPAAKTLVANLDTFTAFASPGSPAGRLQRLDNTEGMAWGPRLTAGRRSLVLASDDNFNPQQITQFLAFEWS